MTLLDEAREAGLIVQADGDTLRIHGPRRLEPLARRLLEHKAEVLAVLAYDRFIAPAAESAESQPFESQKFHFTDGVMDFGDICAGWTPEGWAHELRPKADCCDAYRPDIAAYYRAWAKDIERRLGAPVIRRLNDGD